MSAQTWAQRACTEYALRAVSGTSRVLMERRCDEDGKDWDGSLVDWKDVAVFQSYNDAGRVLAILQNAAQRVPTQPETAQIADSPGASFTDGPEVTVGPVAPGGEACEKGTGWMYCAHADDNLHVCRCSCTCLDQKHCPLLAERTNPPDISGADNEAYDQQPGENTDEVQL